MDAALDLAGVKSGPAAVLTKAALLRNLEIAEKLGCLDAEGMAEMRRGKAPTVRRGPYKGDQLCVDHIIPRAVRPELDNVIANFELMPLRMNENKNDRVGAWQVDLAPKFNKAGLLSGKGLKAALLGDMLVQVGGYDEFRQDDFSSASPIQIIPSVSWQHYSSG